MSEAEDLPSGPQKVCPRCGTEAGEGVWCESCGLNLKQQKELPSADAYTARVREQTWLQEQRREQQEAYARSRQEAATAHQQKLRQDAERREQRRLERKGRWEERRSRLRRPLKIAALTVLVLALIAGAAAAWHLTGWNAPVLGVSPLRDDEPTEALVTDEPVEEQVAPDPARFRGWMGSHSPTHRTRRNAPGGIPTFVLRDLEGGSGTYTLTLEGPEGLQQVYRNRRYSGGFGEVQSEWINRRVHGMIGGDYGYNQALRWTAVWTVEGEEVARWAFRTVPETETADLEAQTTSCPPVPGGAMGDLDAVEIEANGVGCEEAQEIAVEASQAIEAGRPPGQFRPRATVRDFECTLGPMTIGYPIDCVGPGGATVSYRPG